jgi:hypothetical protein
MNATKLILRFFSIEYSTVNTSTFSNWVLNRTSRGSIKNKIKYQKYKPFLRTTWLLITKLMFILLCFVLFFSFLRSLSLYHHSEVGDRVHCITVTSQHSKMLAISFDFKKITSGTDESQDETYTLWKKIISRFLLQVFLVEFETIFSQLFYHILKDWGYYTAFPTSSRFFTSITTRQYLIWTANTLVIIAIEALVNPVLIR